MCWPFQCIGRDYRIICNDKIPHGCRYSCTALDEELIIVPVLVDKRGVSGVSPGLPLPLSRGPW